jgi:hypothetical protein
MPYVIRSTALYLKQVDFRQLGRDVVNLITCHEDKKIGLIVGLFLCCVVLCGAVFGVVGI